MKIPKEEAVELFNAMKGFRVKHTHSKKCAKVAVNRILDAIQMFEPSPLRLQIFDHYIKVLKELDNL